MINSANILIFAKLNYSFIAVITNKSILIESYFKLGNTFIIAIEKVFIGSYWNTNPKNNDSLIIPLFPTPTQTLLLICKSNFQDK